MANMRVVPRNLIEDSRCVLSSSGSPLLSVENLKDPDREMLYRISAGSAIDIMGHWGDDAVRASMAAMLWHNLDTDATWQVIFYPNADWTGTPVYDSGTVTAIDAVTLDDLDFGIDPLGYHIYSPYIRYKQSQVWGVAAGYALKSFKITVTNTTNVDGVINISRLIVGHYFALAYNPEIGAKLSWPSETTRWRTEAGGHRADRGIEYRRIVFDLRYVTDADRIKWMEILRFVGTSQGMFTSVFPEDSSAKKIRDFSGEFVIVSPPEFAHDAGHHTTAMTMEEV